jgi:predicted peroxiredoxin
MENILFIATRGSEDPVLATFPYDLAVGAGRAGYRTAVALLGEAVLTVRPDVVEAIEGTGLPPLREVVREARELGIPVYV